MKNQVLTLESTINFGEHSGKTMAQIIANHPSYLIWMIKNIDYIAFDESVIMELNLPDYIININSQKIEGFYGNSWIDDDIIDDMDEINYSNWKEDTWYAMTDGIYGDMPEDFDGDFSFFRLLINIKNYDNLYSKHPRQSQCASRNSPDKWH